MQTEWAPDFGPSSFVPRWGATATGARKFLIAFNINLLSTKEQAHRIALNLREQGRGPGQVGGPWGPAEAWTGLGYTWEVGEQAGLGQEQGQSTGLTNGWPGPLLASSGEREAASHRAHPASCQGQVETPLPL